MTMHIWTIALRLAHRLHRLTNGLLRAVERRFLTAAKQAAPELQDDRDTIPDFYCVAGEGPSFAGPVDEAEIDAGTIAARRVLEA